MPGRPYSSPKLKLKFRFTAISNVAITSPAAGGEPYLITREQDFAWWQLALLDIYFVLLLAIAAVALLLFAALYSVYWAARRVLRGPQPAKRKAA